jgi:hypothetical protein
MVGHRDYYFTAFSLIVTFSFKSLFIEDLHGHSFSNRESLEKYKAGADWDENSYRAKFVRAPVLQGPWGSATRAR